MSNAEWERPDYQFILPGIDKIVNINGMVDSVWNLSSRKLENIIQWPKFANIEYKYTNVRKE